jgi:hypothetical protein
MCSHKRAVRFSRADQCKSSKPPDFNAAYQLLFLSEGRNSVTPLDEALLPLRSVDAVASE